MKNKIIYLCLFATVWFSLQAQNEKLRVAVFDPTSSGTGVDEGTRMAVRELISSTFVNTGQFTIVERSLIERVMQEQKFSNSGAVDDSQASEIGKLIGANKIVLSVITLAGGRNMLSLKLVDVNTASVERQKTQLISTSELLNIVEPLTLELMGEEVTGIPQTQISVNNPPPVSPVVSQTIRQTPATTATTATDKLAARGRNVYLNDKSLSGSEVQRSLEVNPEALRLYRAGQSKYKTGNTLVIAGSACVGVGAMCIINAYSNRSSYSNTSTYNGHTTIYYEREPIEDRPEFIIGAALAGAGLITGIIGLGTKGNGRRHIQAAVDTYNRTNYTSKINVDFGLTSNGLGFVMRF